MQKTEVKEMLEEILNDMYKEWMSLKEGAKYAGISYNTLIKFRQKGLKIAEVDGIKRISKTEIDKFFQDYSY